MISHEFHHGTIFLRFFCFSGTVALDTHAVATLQRSARFILMSVVAWLAHRLNMGEVGVDRDVFVASFTVSLKDNLAHFFTIVEEGNRDLTSRLF